MIPGMAPAPPGGGHATPDQVAAILQRMHGAEQTPAAQGGNGDGMSDLHIIQSLIQDTHDAMRQIGDPKIVSTLGGCLNQMTSIQATLMAAGPGGK